MLKGKRDVCDLTAELIPSVEAGKVAPSRPAFVQVQFQGTHNVVAANVEGLAIVFDSCFCSPLCASATFRKSVRSA